MHRIKRSRPAETCRESPGTLWVRMIGQDTSGVETFQGTFLFDWVNYTRWFKAAKENYYEKSVLFCASILFLLSCSMHACARPVVLMYSEYTEWQGDVLIVAFLNNTILTRRRLIEKLLDFQNEYEFFKKHNKCPACTTLILWN